MINILEKQFDRLAKKIKERTGWLFKRFGAYLKRLLFPLYLFPIKLVTYTAYYLVKFLIKFMNLGDGFEFDLSTIQRRSGINAGVIQKLPAVFLVAI